jgi:hypothetical protein
MSSDEAGSRREPKARDINVHRARLETLLSIPTWALDEARGFDTGAESTHYSLDKDVILRLEV